MASNDNTLFRDQCNYKQYAIGADALLILCTDKNLSAEEIYFYEELAVNRNIALETICISQKNAIYSASKYLTTEVDIEDVKQACYEALMRKIDTYELDRNTTIHTWIYRDLLDIISKCYNEAIRLTEAQPSIQKKKNNIRNYMHDFYMENGVFPTREEIKEHFNYRESTMKKIEEYFSNDYCSYNKVITTSNEQETSEYVELIQDDTMSIEDTTIYRAINNELYDILRDELSDEDFKILVLTFNSYSDKEIAKYMNISEEDVCISYATSLIRLKESDRLQKMHQSLAN